MGVESRRTPRPPAATDDSTTDITSAREEDVPASGLSGGEEVGTELSRRTDQTHWTIPEDGSPVDIPIRRKRDGKSAGGIGPISSKSQTSLLIEYFEGGKGSTVHSRPSVRVKVTPSAARKIKDTKEHIRVSSEPRSTRKPSYTKRVALGDSSPHQTHHHADGGDDASLSDSYTSAAEQSSLTHQNSPLEIEVMHGDGSDLSKESDRRGEPLAPSDVSSMPPDSMLEEEIRKSKEQEKGGRKLGSTKETLVMDTLQTPERTRSRKSKERLAHKAAEKIAASRTRDVSSGSRKHSSSKTRSRSVSEEYHDSPTKTRRRSSKHREDSDLVSPGESSLADDSALSKKRPSGERQSYQSGTSRSSVSSNTRLLETVENAIRRLIPELETLRQEQKAQKTRSKLETESQDSQSTTSVSRKLSKHASAPDVARKPKVVLNQDEQGRGVLLSGDSDKVRKERRRSRKSESSPSERSFERGMSEETVVQERQRTPHRRSKDGHRLRDSAAAGIAGGVLTAAALSHHDMKHEDSRESLEKRERRRRRSKSHSRSASLAETDQIFHKHDVPPMPLQSDIHSSDLTRTSILSDQTETPSTPTEEIRTAEIQHVTRGSPREIFSPAVRTPKGSPGRSQGLETHHSNQSRESLTPHSNQSVSSLEEKHHSKGAVTGAAVGAAATAALVSHGLHRSSEDEYENDYRPSRALSPIQSVSSRQESEVNRDSAVRAHSSQSISSFGNKGQRASGLSTKSVSSAEDIQFDHSKRPKGMSFEAPEEVLDQHHLRESSVPDEEDVHKDATEAWLKREHEKNDQYRGSIDGGSYREPTVEYNRLTNYTDDSIDAPHLDKVAAAQEVQGEIKGRNPDYRGTPVAVESAVASLLDPSVLSVQSKTGDKSGSDMQDERGIQGPSGVRTRTSKERASPQRGVRSSASPSKDSPRQSLARSVDASPVHIPMGASGVPIAEDPMPEIGHGINSDSDISTNPSIIRGPMGGAQPKNNDHWPYQPTPTQADGLFSGAHSQPSSTHMSAKAAAAVAAAGMLESAYAAGKNSNRSGNKELAVDDSIANNDFGTNKQVYLKGQPMPSPHRDEGYGSGQLDALGPVKAFKDAESWSDGGFPAPDDPFTGGGGHARHLSTNSGLANGTGSPLYDSATGEGLDRIMSKDVVALMDHLTVRDAQRNARDTEIIVTLVRSAAEMRNSFEEMKKFIAEQDDILVEATNRQHSQTVSKIMVGGPRPQPTSSRNSRRTSADGDNFDSAAKKQNVFRRALKGLGAGRSQNDIGRLEERLEQLLMEVQSLRNGQDVQTSMASLRNERTQSDSKAQSPGPSSLKNMVPSPTPASPRQVNYLSTPPTRGPSAIAGYTNRQSSGTRVSTVLEADEDLDEEEQDLLDDYDEQLLTPTRERRRTGSAQPEMSPPPQLHSGSHSNEQTPKTSTEKSRKHKSNSSSFGPKVSRWSRTTASSIGDRFRNGSGKDRPLSEASRSGELHNYEDGHYAPEGDDRLRSNESFLNANRDTNIQREMGEEEGERELEDDDVDDEGPPSPLIPSQVSEDPQYRAVRDSINLQHPQPRPGPTHRYQHHLENQAQQYNSTGSRSPISPTSDTFGSDPALARYMPIQGQRHSGATGALSPISDAGYSEHSAAEQASAPPRPPKVKDDGPLIPTAEPSSASNAAAPPRPPKLATKDNRPTFSSPLSNERLRPEQRYSTASASNEVNRQSQSPRPSTSQLKQNAASQRKPTGPRPIVSSGSYKPRNTQSDVRGSPRPAGSPAHSEDMTF